MATSGVDVRLRIEGHHLPGRRCGPYDDVHVALQVGRDPVGSEAPDVRGPAVQGRPGERFAYLTWGSASEEGFRMFRRAKLMLAPVPDLAGGEPAQVTARVDLTDGDGMPRCARLRPPDVQWSRR